MKQENETYKHRCAIEVLADWINPNFERITFEEQFSFNGLIRFIPDLTCYDKNGISVIYEVEHTCPINAFKLAKMQLYFWKHNINPLVYEIKANWIMDQKCKPNKLNTIRMF